MELRVGARLGSVESTTEVIIIRAATGDVMFTCGGEPVVDVGAGGRAVSGQRDDVADDLVLGKRYQDEPSGLEILVTRAGPGPLEVDGREMALKEAKKLPSSD
jgi:hypothetical protein